MQFESICYFITTAHPSTAQYYPVLPSTAKYSPVQLSRAPYRRTAQVQPSAAQYSPCPHKLRSFLETKVPYLTFYDKMGQFLI